MTALLRLAGGGFFFAVMGCTETPGYLPPCADPQVDCPPLDAGDDGPAEGGKPRDASREAHESAAGE